MNRMWQPIVLLSAITVAACGTPPGLSEAPGAGAVAEDVMAVDYALQPAQAGYGLASVETAAALTVTRVEASSTRNTYFPATHMLDGNLSSAWSPNAADVAPTLTFSLAGTSRLTAVALKMSHSNTTVDVAVRVAGQAWQTVATGLAPVPTTLSDLDFAACTADEVRLTFKGTDLADLLVCEADFNGLPVVGSPSTAPSVTPTAAPSAQPSGTPTTVPSVQPTGVPSAGPTQPPHAGGDRPCTTSGGGWLPVVDKGGKHKISFGFVAKGHRNQCTGTFTVEDLTLKKTFTGEVERVVCRGNFVTLTGRLTTGVRFTATVVDAKRHGKRDTFSFATDDGVLFCGVLAKAESNGGHVKVVQKTSVVLTDDQDDREHEVALEQAGLRVERSDHKLKVRLTEFNALCESEDDEREEAVGRKKHSDNRGKKKDRD